MEQKQTNNTEKQAQKTIQTLVYKSIFNNNANLFIHFYESYNKFIEQKNKFIEQYNIFLKFHENLLNNNRPKLVERSVTYKDNFKLNYEIKLKQSDELHHLLGNRNSNKPEEIIAIDSPLHKKYHSTLDYFNNFYKNLIKKFQKTENVWVQINFFKFKYNDKKDIKVLGQKVRNLIKFVNNNREKYQTIEKIPDEIISGQLKKQTDDLWEQFFISSNNEIINREIIKLKSTKKSVNSNIKLCLQKDFFKKIVKDIYKKYISRNVNKLTNNDILNRVTNAIREHTITKEEIGNVITVELNLYLDKFNKSNVRNKKKFITNQIKELKKTQTNLFELIDYGDYLSDRLNDLIKFKNTMSFELADNIRMDKINKISAIKGNINTIVENRKESQSFLINYMKSNEFFDNLKEINFYFENILEKKDIVIDIA